MPEIEEMPSSPMTPTSSKAVLEEEREQLETPLSPMTPTSTTAMLEEEEKEELTSKKPTYWRKFWKRNQGMFLILIGELFGALMITSARLLQNGTAERPGNMLTLQIIFVRFGLTFVFSMLYMWLVKVPDFPLGKPGVRWLLVARGAAGFWGVFGFYYSVKYLPVAEAIVLGFFTPLLTAYMCNLILHTPFTRTHFIGGILCLLGVVLIAHPASLFPGNDSAPSPKSPILHGNQTLTSESQPEYMDPYTDVPAAKRLLAVALGVSSCIGSASVFTIIRLIGPSTHALISVNYYAFLSMILSFLLLLFLPQQFPISQDSIKSTVDYYFSNFQFPSDIREWLLLLSLGVYGFLLQFLVTKGLQLEKGARGTNMMYVQIIFALAMDWGIWGVWPGMWSWIGGAIVVGSTVWVAMQKDDEGEERKERDEEVGFIGHGSVDDGYLSDGDEIEMKDSKC